LLHLDLGELEQQAALHLHLQLDQGGPWELEEQVATLHLHYYYFFGH
jgi:hypothetical protein